MLNQHNANEQIKVDTSHSIHSLSTHCEGFRGKIVQNKRICDNVKKKIRFLGNSGIVRS